VYVKIGILSDSHDNLPAIGKAVSLFNDADVSLVVHAGDLVSPFVKKSLKNLEADFLAVFGNNDGEKLGLSQLFSGKIHRAPFILDYHGKHILILHEPDNLEALIKSNAFHAIIYGHTHKADIRKGTTLVINPGECGGWLFGERTVAIWNMDTGDAEIVRV
jgi:putative phosphoesterase